MENGNTESWAKRAEIMDSTMGRLLETRSRDVRYVPEIDMIRIASVKCSEKVV